MLTTLVLGGQVNAADYQDQYDSHWDHENLTRGNIKIHIAEQFLQMFYIDLGYGCQ